MSVPTSSLSLEDSHKESSTLLGSELLKTNTDTSNPDESALLEDLKAERGRSRFLDSDRHGCIRKPSKQLRPSLELSSTGSGLFTPPASSTKLTSTTKEPSAPEEGEIILPEAFPSSRSSARSNRNRTSKEKEHLLKYGCIRAASGQKIFADKAFKPSSTFSKPDAVTKDSTQKKS